MKLSEIAVNTKNSERLWYSLRIGIYLRSRPTSKALSKRINQFLDDPNTELILYSEYSVILGDLRLWVRNFPYSYGFFYGNPDEYLEELIYLSPDTDRWKVLERYTMRQQEYRKEFGNRLPDRATVFRLNQVVKAAKEISQASTTGLGGGG